MRERRVTDHRPGSWVPTTPPRQVVEVIGNSALRLDDGVTYRVDDPEAHVEWPRRPDGSVKRWNHRPPVDRLRAGDVLPDGSRVDRVLDGRVYLDGVVPVRDVRLPYIELFGPYWYEPTGHLFLFAYKNGRGRWTSAIPPRDDLLERDANCVWISRMPADASWEGLHFEPEWGSGLYIPRRYRLDPGRHPFDPLEWKDHRARSARFWDSLTLL